MEAALSQEGTSEVPAAVCYEDIYVRDHWKQLTKYPWWYTLAPDVHRQMLWRREVIERTGQDWFVLPSFYSREDQQAFSIDVKPEGVFRVDARTGREERLVEPEAGGWSALDGVQSVRPSRLADTPEEIDVLLTSTDNGTCEIEGEGRDALARELLKEFGNELYPISHVPTPLWSTYRLWGFEGMMLMIARRPNLVEHACRRFLEVSVRRVHEAASLGAAAVWVEECLTDMIRPESFATLNIPSLRRLIEEIRAVGLKSVHYFCGNPAGKWDQLLSVGADAIAFEESKKDFTVDIDDVVARVGGRCTVFGNLDAIGVLQNGSETRLRAEITRQIAAGQRNGGRFVMCLGSPVTPGTPVERVRLYCDLVHELGAF